MIEDVKPYDPTDDEWLRVSALGKSIDYFEKVYKNKVLEGELVFVAEKFFKFLKGEVNNGK
jgi:hypothetical protein